MTQGSTRWLPFVAVPLLVAPASWALEGAAAPPGTETTITDYRLWVPDKTVKVRGVIAVSNHEAGSAIYYDNQTWGDQKDATLGYRDLAARLDLGLFLFKKFADDNNYVESHQREIYAALAELGEASGHAEVQHAGVIPTGLSAGGWWSGWLGQFQPNRVIAYYPIAGGPEELADVAELLAVPSLYINQGALQVCRLPGRQESRLLDAEPTHGQRLRGLRHERRAPAGHVRARERSATATGR